MNFQNPSNTSGDRVDPGLFAENDHYSHLRRTVRVDPKTLGTNDHHGHLVGSLGYPRPLTLPQNSIGSLRGDSDPTCASRVCPVFQPGLFGAIRVCSKENSPNPTHQRSNPTLEGPIPHLGASMSGNTWIVVEKNIPT
ncbi:hypothetical protein CRG98_029752 [Punica granatum]|uniref:Uncharacterized protein n=1 Tax=Punica granatum TaxID=22663 RepID=A0A2I0J0R1_PUNGR|nr:hypothetical protein CRG98_029752 [Punica granatum]